jgi:ribosomal protein L7/L12
MGFMKFLEDLVFSSGKQKKEQHVDLQGLSDDDAKEEIKKLVDAGQKMEAIKLVREVHNCGLKEAKDIVEQMD